MVEEERTGEGWKLTKPMVDIISQVIADCLDLGENINKEARPV